MSLNETVCKYVARHPLCLTEDVAKHIGRSVEHTSKLMNRLELTDHLRVPTKTGRLNRWIVGTNQTFGITRHFNARGNGGGTYYPTNGSIDRKRVVTVTVSADDAMTLLATGYSKMKVV